MKGHRIHFSEQELAWLKARAVWPRPRLHAEFCNVFSRQDVSCNTLKAFMTRSGWRTGRNSTHNTYSPEELVWLKARSDMPRKRLHSEFCNRFQRTDVTFGALKGVMKRNRWLTGRTGQFEKGRMGCSSDGRRMADHPSSKATRFKKGHVPHNQNYIGHERINHEGYVEISVAERNPHTNADRRYVAKHRWLWEQANGPVPDGHVLKCSDGDKTNTDPKNWLAIPRALLPRLNGRWGNLSYDDAEPELKPFILATAKLQHAAREARKEHRS
ncbi:HNH endonuclease [uncultured Tateyamaria sp.]|uniref:HNH endonuclease n=1 Tax=uncultured Tateyamaria sp. TaxID=455651 RepID=UPI0026316F7D|nr:HNH endonuclease [uncultured Tateyamaria sp.]